MPENIVIIGGGLAGLCTAFELAKFSGHNLFVIEAEEVGSRCSSKAAGLLTPASEVQFKDDAFLSIINQSLNYYPKFVAELTHHHPALVDFQNNGHLLCAFENDGERDLARVVDFKKTMGFAIDPLSKEELKRKEPLLSARVTSAFYAKNEGCLDTLALIKTLRQELLATDFCKIIENTKVVSTTIEKHRVTSMRLSNGETLPCSHLVLASGLKHEIPEIQEAFPLSIRPVKGEALSVQLPVKSLNHPVQIYHRYPVYLSPRASGEVVIGATSQERSDEDVTAGAVLELLFSAWQVLPILAEHKLNRVWAGLRPTTPDNYPVVGKTPLENLFCLLGLYRKGVLLAPYLGAQLAKLILQKTTELDWRLLRHDRF